MFGSNKEVKRIQEAVDRKLAENKPSPAKLPWTDPRNHQPKTKGRK
jgi:hypothetical protein